MTDVSVFDLLVRLAVSLGVVLAIMAGAAYALRRAKGISPVSRRRQPAVEVLTRQPLGRSASLAVVRAGDRALVLGVTDGGITLLTEAPSEELQIELSQPSGTAAAGDPLAAPMSWKGVLEVLRERTVRRS